MLLHKLSLGKPRQHSSALEWFELSHKHCKLRHKLCRNWCFLDVLALKASVGSDFLVPHLNSKMQCEVLGLYLHLYWDIALAQGLQSRSFQS